MARDLIPNMGGLDALGQYVKGRAADAAIAMGVDAETLAPVDTGALKVSVDVIEVTDQKWRIIAGRGLPDGRAVYQELGTSKMRAQPYIRPAVLQDREF